MYIIVEGIDTCGKSTQIDLLKPLFTNAVFTKEPGGTAFGMKAREILLEGKLRSKRAELLLFLSDRAEHFEQKIAPNRDKLIVSDRGFISGVGYGLANGDFDFETMMDLNHFALSDTLPDAVILFLTDMETLTQRTSKKSLDGIELRGLEYLMSVQTHMHQSVEKLNIPHLYIDATQNIETIHQQIVDFIQEKQ